MAHGSPVDDHRVYRLVGLEAAAVTTAEMCPAAAHLIYITWMSSLLEAEMQHTSAHSVIKDKKLNDILCMFFI